VLGSNETELRLLLLLKKLDLLALLLRELCFLGLQIRAVSDQHLVLIALASPIARAITTKCVSPAACGRDALQTINLL
jgi:hypothetical protein